MGKAIEIGLTSVDGVEYGCAGQSSALQNTTVEASFSTGATPVDGGVRAVASQASADQSSDAEGKAVSTGLDFVGGHSQGGCGCGCNGRPVIYRSVWDRLCLQLFGAMPPGMDPASQLEDIAVWADTVTLVSDVGSYSFTIETSCVPVPAARDFIFYKDKYYVIGSVSNTDATHFLCTNCQPIDESIIAAYLALVNTNEYAIDEELERAANESARVEAERQRQSAEETREWQAGQDHGTAMSDHTTASRDHTTATQDHGTAQADHILADADHGTASSDHTRAEDDHRIAAADHSRADQDHQSIASAVLFTPQTLTEEQQAQARENIGAGTGGGSDPDAVHFTEQSLTTEQKAQARTNIGAGTYSKPANGIPSSDLADGVIPDVSGFITKSVNDLTNYYLKSETYTQAEVNALIGAIQQFHYEIAASTSAVSSPASNVLYLIGPTGSGADKYEEYVYPNSTQGWVKIGDTSIDLSGYVTTQDLNTALASYVTSTALTTTLADYLPLAGGTMTGPITLAPGDGKGLLFELTSNINVKGTSYTVFGFLSGTFIIGSVAYNLLLRGKLARPQYRATNNASTAKDIALLEDIPDVSGKADKVSGATSGNFAGLDSNGNLTDSGSKASDFATAAQGAKADTAVQPESGKGLFSGSYNDLTDKPTIPSAQVNSDWNANSGVAQILNKPTIPDVSNCVQKSNTAGLLKNDGTVDTTAYGTYSKPSGGIPKTDLSSGVQSSLDLADSAIQSSPVGQVTPSVNPYDYATRAELEQMESYVYGTSAGQTTTYLFELGSIDGSNGQEVTQTNGTRIRSVDYIPKGDGKVSLTVERSCTRANIILYKDNVYAGWVDSAIEDLVAGTYIYQIQASVDYNQYRVVCFTSGATAANVENNYCTTHTTTGLQKTLEDIEDSVRELEDSLFCDTVTEFELGSVDGSNGEEVERTDGKRIRTGYLEKRDGKFSIYVERTCSLVNIVLYKNGVYAGWIDSFLGEIGAGEYYCTIKTTVDYDQFRAVCFTTGATAANVANNHINQRALINIDGPDKIDPDNIDTAGIYAAYDALAAMYPNYISKRVLGYDTSGQHEIREYVATLRNQYAYLYKDKCYAWKNGNTKIYTKSVSPRVGDATYTDQLTTSTGYTVTTSSVTSIVVNGVTYSQDTSSNIDADIVYRDSGSSSTVTVSGKTYSRVANFDKSTLTRKTIVSVCNEHGPGEQGDPREPSIAMYYLLWALCGETISDPKLDWLKKYARIVIIPVLNPYAYDEEGNASSLGTSMGRVNSNGVNINRNYPTTNWASTSESGSYPGSEVETQYAINCIKQHGADVAIDCHCLGPDTNNYGKWHYEGATVDIIGAETILMMAATYNLVYSSYGKGAAGRGDTWITQQGIDGCLLEMNQGYGGSLHGDLIFRANRFIWMSVLDIYDIFDASE